ncbi:hypothetical protein AMECASPLE_003538 [Ameca splendens]|uniref:Uncharacterized protein n=1 Tax=Ameca splendens TaxID=208324 RepID=A0ABV1A727_9TELE
MSPRGGGKESELVREVERYLLELFRLAPQERLDCCFSLRAKRWCRVPDLLSVPVRGAGYCPSRGLRHSAEGLQIQFNSIQKYFINPKGKLNVVVAHYEGFFKEPL